MFVGGKLPADLRQQLNKAFGDLSLKPADPKLGPIPAMPAAEKKIPYQKMIPTGAGRHPHRQAFPNRHHPDFGEDRC